MFASVWKKMENDIKMVSTAVGQALISKDDEYFIGFNTSD